MGPKPVPEKESPPATEPAPALPSDLQEELNRPFEGTDSTDQQKSAGA
jgi:hypothetical protein